MVYNTLKGQIGVQTLVCLLLVIGAIFGLSLLEEQVPVWSFGDSSTFDAQFFPRIILSLIVLSVVIRMVLKFRERDDAIGSFKSWLRVLIVAISVVIALLLMSAIGFLASAFLAAFVTAITFGERNLIYNIGVPLVVAALVTYGARSGLSIPLP